MRWVNAFDRCGRPEIYGERHVSGNTLLFREDQGTTIYPPPVEGRVRLISRSTICVIYFPNTSSVCRGRAGNCFAPQVEPSMAE